MSPSRFVIFASCLLFATHEAARMKRKLDLDFPEKKNPPKKKPQSATELWCASKYQNMDFSPAVGPCTGCLIPIGNGKLPYCHHHFAGKVACQPEEGKVWCGGNEPDVDTSKEQKNDAKEAALQAATCGGVTGKCSTSKDNVKAYGDCCMTEEDGKCASGFELRSHPKYKENVCQALETEKEQKDDAKEAALQAATCGGVTGKCSTSKDNVKAYGDCCMTEEDGKCASGFELRSHPKYKNNVCQALETEEGKNNDEEAASCIDVEFDIGYGGCASYAAGKSNHGFCSKDKDEEGRLAQDVCPQCNACTVAKGSGGDAKDSGDAHPTKAPKGPVSAGDVSCTTSKFQAESGAPMEPGQCKGCLVQMNTGPPMCSYHFAGKAACQPEEGSVWCGE